MPGHSYSVCIASLSHSASRTTPAAPKAGTKLGLRGKRVGQRWGWLGDLTQSEPPDSWRCKMACFRCFFQKPFVFSYKRHASQGRPSMTFKSVSKATLKELRQRSLLRSLPYFYGHPLLPQFPYQNGRYSGVSLPQVSGVCCADFHTTDSGHAR